MSARLASATFAVFCIASIASAETPAPLEQQLQELKQQYSETTRSLEQRMAALEQQIEKEKTAKATPTQGTVSVGDR